MKLRLSLVLVLLIGLPFTSQIFAQDSPKAPAETAADLRMRLIEVQTKEANVRARLAELDEALKPENIERSLAGVGSTRPEELREQRRRELTIERDSTRKQLELLETSRLRLESAIQLADTLAYQQSAQGYSANSVQSTLLSFASPRRLVIASTTFLVLAIGVFVVFIRRR